MASRSFAVLVLASACASTTPAPEPKTSIPAAAQRVVGIETPEGSVRITVPRADAVRLRLSPTATFPPDRSWAVDVATLPAAAFTVEESAEAVTVRTEALTLKVSRKPLRLTLLDAKGEVIADEGAVAWKKPAAQVSWKLPTGEHVYGLGDKAKGFDRRGQSFELWNSDAYGWGRDTDPLYKSIPFLLFLREGRAHGLFVDSPSRAFVDVGEAKPDLLTWDADAAPSGLDLYLFAGPEPKRVIEAFTALTGRMPLPPLWSLGYHQCRYSYETEAEVREVARRLRADRIPSDVVWLDIDFQDANAPFTVDSKHFPTFPQLITDLRASHLNTVVITDPHIKVLKGYAPYDTGLAGDYFIRDVSGEPFVGVVWPGDSVFPELTLSRTRLWWGGLYKDFVGQGIAGFWNDMNEPALFARLDKTMPGNVPHRLDDGTTLEHTAVHNAYGLLNARATYEGVLGLRPKERPFVLTRAAYAGAQRWAASWTGDNLATREHLALTIPTLANLGVSGYAFVGADVGGFAGCPDAALLTEWMELGALQPFFRNHSAKGTCRREPWVHGDAEEARRRAAVERRYRLLPYLYTAFEESSRNGIPVMRPLWLEYPSDASTWTNDRAFLLGRDLLVAPKLAEGIAPFPVTLPQGGWYDERSGTRVPGVGGTVQVTPADQESVRIFVRAGAIVPQQPVVQYASQKPEGPLSIHVYPGPDCFGMLYLDDGETFDFRNGAFRRIVYRCELRANGIRITADSTGKFPIWWRETEVVVHGALSPYRSLKAGMEAKWSYDSATQAETIVLAEPKSDWALEASW